MQTLMPEQPLSYKAIIKKSFTIYKKSFLRVLPLAIVLTLTAFIPRILSAYFNIDLLNKIEIFSLEQLWLLPVNIVAIIFFVGILWRIHCVMINRHEPFIEDLVIGLKKLLLVIIANLFEVCTFLAITISFFMLQLVFMNHGILFGDSYLSLIFTACVFTLQFFLTLYLLTLFIFLLPIIAVENKGILSALKRSIQAAWNHFFRIIFLQATPWITYLFFLIFIKNTFKIDVHIYLTNSGPDATLPIIFNMIAFTAFLPWAACILLLQLHDLELRNHLITQDTTRHG